MMRNCERFADYEEAERFFEGTFGGTIVRLPWGFGKWLFMEFRPGESEVEFLGRCKAEGILTNNGTKRLEKLVKEGAKGGRADGGRTVPFMPGCAMDGAWAREKLLAFAAVFVPCLRRAERSEESAGVASAWNRVVTSFGLGGESRVEF